MALWRVISKDDLVYVPYELPANSRINLKNILKYDFSRTVLVYCGVPFVVKIGESETVFKKDGAWYSARTGGCFRDLIWFFIDKKSGKQEKILYMQIEVDPDVIPRFMLDIVFFHELREMYYRVVLKESEKFAHKKAKKDERSYVKKFLSADQKRKYKKFYKEFKPAIRKIKGKVVRICPQ